MWKTVIVKDAEPLYEGSEKLTLPERAADILEEKIVPQINWKPIWVLAVITKAEPVYEGYKRIWLPEKAMNILVNSLKDMLGEGRPIVIPIKELPGKTQPKIALVERKSFEATEKINR